MTSLIITSVLAKRLRDEMRQHPLHNQEVRRIKGLGRWYIATASTNISEHGLAMLFTLTNDDTAYVVGVPLEKEYSRADRTETRSKGD